MLLIWSEFKFNFGNKDEEWCKNGVLFVEFDVDDEEHDDCGGDK